MLESTLHRLGSVLGKKNTVLRSEPLCYTTAVNSLRSVPERNYIPKPDLSQYSTLFHKTWNFLQKTFIFAVGSQNTGLLSGQTI